MKKEITTFFDKEYQKFALYTIENRAINSIIDSFKPSHRKIIYTAIKTVKTSSNKVSTLAGNVIAQARFHHGNVSLEDSIVGMSQIFKNNLPLLDGIGQFGILKATFASSARYIAVMLSKNFDLVYKDNELLEYKEDEGFKIEPKFYLPIIPMILINSSGGGIAVGFATNILNRTPKEITKTCIGYLEGKKINKTTPYINGFTGEVINDSENHKRWFFKGRFEKVNTTTLKITEIPPSMTYEKFEDLLDKLAEKQEIYSWENQSKENNLSYTIRMERSYLSSLTEEQIYKLFKLIDIEVENFTVLDENNKLKIFEKSEDIIKYFVDFRLIYYNKRKDFLLKKIKEEIDKLDNKSLFIKGVIDEKIIVNNKKKEDIIKQIEKLKIQKINNSFDYLLSMPIYSLTKEKYEELQLEIKDKKMEEENISSSISKDVYLNELKELLKVL